EVFCVDVESSSASSVDNPLSCDGCSSTVSDSVTVTSGSDASGLASDVSSVELPHPVIASPAANTNAAKGFVGVLVDIAASPRDRKSTRLNSSHVSISYAVFCLKKKINYI